MIRRILITMVTAMLLSTAPAVMAQDVQKNPVETQKQATAETELQAIAITVTESTLHIKNAAQQVVEVYNLAGVKVITQKIDSADKAIELSSLPKGCYIIKVGNTVRKVYLK